jgi:hypothetical protein
MAGRNRNPVNGPSASVFGGVIAAVVVGVRGGFIFLLARFFFFELRRQTTILDRYRITTAPVTPWSPAAARPLIIVEP